MGNGSRLRAIALLAAALLAGAAAGWFGHEKMHRGHRAGRHGPERLVEHLTKELALTAAQQDSVRAILDRRRVDIDSLWAGVHPRFEAVRSLTHAQIEAVLTPGQQEKFREETRKREERRREHGRAKAPR